jgi:nitronate monooxygenase
VTGSTAGPSIVAGLFGIAVPIIQAPMVGPKTGLAAAVSAAGGLGSLACAALTPDQIRTEVAQIRAATAAPFNLNFFCHAPAAPDPGRDAAWRSALASFYEELGLDPAAPVTMANRTPFDDAMAEVVAELRPRVVSFHFGLPAEPLLRRVREAGCLILSSATTVREARWLAERGVDAVIAQGAEAGGHRGMFLTDAPASQVGTIALVPQIVDAVDVPVIAAGGIADPRGVAAAFALGAGAVQVGTAYLRCPEAGIAAPYRAALNAARDEDTALTNVLTGRPARGLLNRVVREMGPLSAAAPAFPGAAVALQPLRTAAEARGSGDFSPLWSGQAVGLSRERPAAELTRLLASGVPGV